MAAKRIKFIAIDPQNGKVAIADAEKLREANRVFAKSLTDHPVSQALGQYGTNVLINAINEAGGLPTKNFTAGQFAEHDFNQRAGFTNVDDRLPEFFYSEPLAPHNTVFDLSGEEIDSFWNF